MKRILLAALVAASFVVRAGEPQGPKSVMANSYGVLTAPTNFFSTNATTIAAALAPWLGGGALTNVTLLTYGDETSIAPNSLKLTAGAGMSLTTNVTDLVVAAPVIPELTNAPALLYGTTSAYLPSALKLTAGANITLTTNGQNLEIAGAAGGAGTGTVTHATGPLTLNLPVLGNDGDDLKSVSAATFRAAVDLEPGVDVEAYNIHLEDLADGSLTGTKVGTGIAAGNISSGLLDNARLSTSVTLDTDWDSAVEIAANLSVADKTGSGKLVFADLPFIQTPTIDNLSGMNHIHQGSTSGGYLSADAIFSGTFNSNRFTPGMITAANTLIVDAINGDDITGARGRSDFPFQTLAAAVDAMQSGDTILMRPGTNTVSVYTNDFLEATQYEAPIVVSNKSNWSIIGEPGSVIQADDHGTIMLVDASSNWKIDGLTFRGAGTTAVPEDAYFAAIQLYRTNSNFTVTRCTFEDIGEHGIATLWGQRNARYFRVANNFGTRIGNTNSVLTYDGTFIAVSGREGIIEGNVGQDILRGIEIEGSQGLGLNIAVKNNIIHDVWNIGIMMFGNSTDSEAFRRVDISGNQIRGVANTHPCWAFGGFGITWEGNASGRISENVISRFVLSGLNVYSPRSTTIRDLVIVGNVVSEVGDAGIQVIPYPGFTNQVMDCIIANNSIRAAATEGGIRVGGIGHRVMGNIVTKSQGPGITTYTNGLSETRGIVIEGNTVSTNGTYGIVVAQGSAGTVLRGNTFAGNTSGTISDSGTGTLINTFETLTATGAITGDTVADSVGDLRTGTSGIDSKMDGDKTTATIAEGPRLWELLQQFDQLHHVKPPTSDQTNYTGTAFSMDCDGPERIEWEITGDATHSMINAPAEGERIGLRFQMNLNCTVESNCVLVLDPLVTQGTKRAPGSIKSGEFLTIWLDWNGTNWVADWRGDQSDPLPPALGGRGLTNRNEVVVWPAAYGTGGSNRFDADLQQGERQYFRAASETNAYLAASSGRPTHTNELAKSYWRVRNSNSSAATNTWAFRPDWNLIGFENDLLTLTNGQYGVFELWAEGPDESDVWVVNRLATVASLGGGGSPPASTLGDYAALWKLDETSGSTADNAEGTAALDLFEYGGAWTKNVAHSMANITPGWTNTATSRVLTNDDSGLELGRSGASFSIVTVFAPYVVTGGASYNILGENDSGVNQRALLTRIGTSGTWQVLASSDGSAATTLSSSFTAVASTLYMVVTTLDNANNLLKIAVFGGSNDGTYQTTTFSGDLHDSTAPFSLGGTFSSGSVTGGARGLYDQTAVYTRALSQAEIEELWNGGDIIDLSTL